MRDQHQKRPRSKKLLLRLALLLVTAALGYGIWYLSSAMAIISAYGAKNLCSGVFVSGRTADDVIRGELGTALSSLGTYRVNEQNSEASGSVFGLFRRVAVYRPGLGCTLVNGTDAATLRMAPNPFPENIEKLRVQQDTMVWPSGNRTSGVLPQNVDSARLNQVVEAAFQEFDNARLMNTRAVLIVWNDTIIAERYAPGFTADMPLCGWSMTKSITNALIGIQTGDGKLDVNAPAPVSEWASDERKNITLKNLLQASSGLDWDEFYGGPSDATTMLFKAFDAGAFAAARPRSKAPDEEFRYSSGTTNILSRLVRQAAGKNYPSMVYERLLLPIGMTRTVLEPDPSGTLVGSSYSYGPARDWARFGLLYLHDGVWNGNRILPEGWVKFTATPARAAQRGEYGAQWWLNAGEPGNPANRTYPDVPADCFQAEGFEGQYVFVIPSRKLVVVRLGLTQSGDFDMNRLVSGVLSAIK